MTVCGSSPGLRAWQPGGGGRFGHRDGLLLLLCRGNGRRSAAVSLHFPQPARRERNGQTGPRAAFAKEVRSRSGLDPQPFVPDSDFGHRMGIERINDEAVVSSIVVRQHQTRSGPGGDAVGAGEEDKGAREMLAVAVRTGFRANARGPGRRQAGSRRPADTPLDPADNGPLFLQIARDSDLEIRRSAG